MKLTEIGEIVQRRREFLALKQEDLAEMSGLTPKTIYLIEQGKGNPSINTLQRILDVLGLDLLLQLKKTDA